MIRISVIVPVYNVEKYIRACLDSIRDCGVPLEELELVVVDDESPDGSMAIAAEIVTDFPHAQIVSQKNTGISGARNAGLNHASAPYILFIDSDDWIKPGKLNHLLQLAEQQNLDVLEFGIERVKNDGSILSEETASSNGEIWSGVDYYKRVRYVNSVFNKLYKRSLLEQHQIRFLEKIYVEDFEFNTRVFLLAKRVRAVPDLVYQYRQSDNSITRSQDARKQRKMLQDHIFVLRQTKQLFDQEKEAMPKAFLGERMSFLVVSAFFFMLKNGFPLPEIRQLKASLKEENLYVLNFPIHQSDKNLFRIFLKWAFPLLPFFQKVFT